MYVLLTVIYVWYVEEISLEGQYQSVVSAKFKTFVSLVLGGMKL